MYNVKELYKCYGRTIYYIVSDKSRVDIRVNVNDLDNLVAKNLVYNAKREIQNNIKGLYVYDTNIIETSNLITLYHISIDKPSDKMYVPRIPSSAAEIENKTIKRICLSTSIEGCLTAMNMTMEELDKAIINKPIYLLKTIIAESDKRLLKPEYLYDNNLVMDTPVTNEHWYTGAIIPEVKKIEVSSFNDDFKNVASEKDRKAVYNELKNAGVAQDILKDMDNYSVSDLVNYKVEKYNRYMLSKEIELDLTEVIYCANIVKDVEYRVIT